MVWPFPRLPLFHRPAPDSPSPSPLPCFRLKTLDLAGPLAWYVLRTLLPFSFGSSLKLSLYQEAVLFEHADTASFFCVALGTA